MREGLPCPPRNGEGDRAKRGGGGHVQLQRPVVYFARRLRKDMSPPEAKLWQHLCQRPGGLKFRRQHPIDPYVADFYCREGELITEVDGWGHDTTAGAEHDEKRDLELQKRGFTLMRVPAGEVMRDCAAVVSGILARVGSPLHRTSCGPPPRSGEDF
jgi:very-short-patch-repair endonuclease